MSFDCAARTDGEPEDDITVCTVSDTTGRIALGARGGSIIII